MEGYGKTGKDTKCPVMHGSMTNTEYGMAIETGGQNRLICLFCINMTKNLIQWVKILIIEKSLKNWIMRL